jgi:hypothetical protein
MYFEINLYHLFYGIDSVVQNEQTTGVCDAPRGSHGLLAVCDIHPLVTSVFFHSRNLLNSFLFQYFLYVSLLSMRLVLLFRINYWTGSRKPRLMAWEFVSMT